MQEICHWRRAFPVYGLTSLYAHFMLGLALEEVTEDMSSQLLVPATMPATYLGGTLGHNKPSFCVLPSFLSKRQKSN